MHAIDMSNARANVAYVGNTPWHGLGTELSNDTPFDEWRVAAGLDWTADVRRLSYPCKNALGEPVDVLLPSHRVLVRDDTQSVLGVLSKDYKVVQPRAILDFFRELCDGSDGHFRMETAGCLFDGKRIWALASTPDEIVIGEQDVIKPYLLLGTSFDGSTSTFASFTSVRVVCHNTLSMSVGLDGQLADVRIPHMQKFDAEAVKTTLGLIEDKQEAAYSGFAATANGLAGIPVDDGQMFEYFATLYGPKPDEGETVKDITVDRFTVSQKATIEDVIKLYKSGPGSAYETARGTAWGLVNAVTRHEDFNRGKSDVRRLQSAGFGAGMNRKRRAVELGLGLEGAEPTHVAAIEADGGDLLQSLLNRPTTVQ